MRKLASPFALISIILALPILWVGLFSVEASACANTYISGLPIECSISPNFGFPGSPNSCIPNGCTEAHLSCQPLIQAWDSQQGVCVDLTPPHQCEYQGGYNCAIAHGVFWYNTDCCPGAVYPTGLFQLGCSESSDGHGCRTITCDWMSTFECGTVEPDGCEGGMTCPEGQVATRAYPSCWYTCHCPNEDSCLNRTPGDWVADEAGLCADCVCRDFPCGGRKQRNPDTCVCECSPEDVASCASDRSEIDPDTCSCRCADYATSIEGRITPFYNSYALGLEIKINKRVGGSTGWLPFDSTSGDCWFYTYQHKTIDLDGNVIAKDKNLGYFDWVWCNAYGTDNVINGLLECYTGGAPYLEFGTYSGVEMDCWNMTCNFDDWGFMKVDIVSPELTLNNDGFNYQTEWGYSTYSFLWSLKAEVFKGGGATPEKSVEKRGNRLRLSRGGYEKRDQ